MPVWMKISGITLRNVEAVSVCAPVGETLVKYQVNGLALPDQPMPPVQHGWEAPTVQAWVPHPSTATESRAPSRNRKAPGGDRLVPSTPAARAAGPHTLLGIVDADQVGWAAKTSVAAPAAAGMRGSPGRVRGKETIALAVTQLHPAGVLRWVGVGSPAKPANGEISAAGKMTKKNGTRVRRAPLQGGSLLAAALSLPCAKAPPSVAIGSWKPILNIKHPAAPCACACYFCCWRL